jgi:hypothetical protein
MLFTIASRFMGRKPRHEKFLLTSVALKEQEDKAGAIWPLSRLSLSLKSDFAKKALNAREKTGLRISCAAPFAVRLRSGEE